MKKTSKAGRKPRMTANRRRVFAALRELKIAIMAMAAKVEAIEERSQTEPSEPTLIEVQYIESICRSKANAALVWAKSVGLA